MNSNFETVRTLVNAIEPEFTKQVDCKVEQRLAVVKGELLEFDSNDFSKLMSIQHNTKKLIVGLLYKNKENLCLYIPNCFVECNRLSNFHHVYFYEEDGKLLMSLTNKKNRIPLASCSPYLMKDRIENKFYKIILPPFIVEKFGLDALEELIILGEKSHLYSLVPPQDYATHADPTGQFESLKELLDYFSDAIRDSYAEPKGVQ